MCADFSKYREQQLVGRGYNFCMALQKSMCGVCVLRECVQAAAAC